MPRWAWSRRSTAALAHAINQWLIAEWLEPEPRLRASLVVPVRPHLLQVLDPDAVAGAIAAFLGSARAEMVGGSGSASADVRSAAPGPEGRLPQAAG